MQHTTHYRVCPLCEATCGLEIKVQDNTVSSIRGNDADVFSKGYICPKAVALKDLHDDPDRVRTPLIKRDGRFVPATWGEAFTEIERRLMPILAQHGRDAAGFVIGNPTAHKMGLLLYFPKLARALGSKNVFSASTLDQMPKQLASGLMFGHWLSVALPDIERTDFLLILGGNPVVSNGSMWTVPDFRGKAKALRARGGKLVVIDPRRSETADVADQHHFVRPGTDLFLLAAIAHTLFAERLVKLGRLAQYVNGVGELEAALKPFTPAAASAACGIDAATIRQLARELAAAPRACVYGRMGTSVNAFGTLCNWLVDCLNVLTGNLDREGGALFAKSAGFAANNAGKPGVGKGVVTGRYKARVSGAPEVFGELPMGCLGEEIETPGAGQIKALITLAGNPVLCAPNGARLAKALEQLDFMLSVDIYVNETTRHADVILPGLSPLEEAHFDVAFPQLSYRNAARFSLPVLRKSLASNAPRAEWRTLLALTAIVQGKGANADVEALDDDFLSEEVRRSGVDEALHKSLGNKHGPGRLVDLALRTGPYGTAPHALTLAKLKEAPNGIDLGALESRIPGVLRTPSGKVELAPPSCIADLPRALATLRAPPAHELQIIGRRQVRSNNSWMHNLPTLAKGPVRCTLEVNPTDAKRLMLEEGQLARLSTVHGSITAPVAVSERMMPGIVCLPHGWGHDAPGTALAVAAERPGANLNALFTTEARDPLSGNAVLNGVAVSLAAA